MRTVKKIIVHCSASGFGDAALIDRWHRERGWDGIGYHYVILNGCRDGIKAYRAIDDGVIEPGRPEEKQGAHCKGENGDSIGICLIGDQHFTPEQLFLSLPLIVKSLLGKHGLTVDDVFCHSEFNHRKTCPNINAGVLRDVLKERIKL